MLAPPSGEGWIGVAYSLGYNAFWDSMACTSCWLASEMGIVLIQVIEILAPVGVFAYNPPRQTKLYVKAMLCQARRNLQPHDPGKIWIPMSIMVWNLMRRLPRPVLLVVIFFLLSSLARA